MNRQIATRIILYSALTGMIVALSVRYHHVVSASTIIPHPAAVLARAMQESPQASSPPHVDVLRTDHVPQHTPQEPLTLQLALRGTALLPQRIACLEHRTTHRTGLYREGDAIAAARIAAIGSGFVWLERAGVFTLLQLEDLQPGDPALNDREVEDNAPHPASITIPTRAGGPALRLTPSETSEGVFKGLRVESLDDTSWVARLNLGLRQGDVIIAANGHPLRTPQQTLQVMRKAMHQPDFDLVVNRDGQPVTLHALHR